MVFSDASLRDMCRCRPTTAEQFLGIKGVGRKKGDAYGPLFLQAIRTYTETAAEDG